MKKNQLYIIALFVMIITSQSKAQNTNVIIGFIYNEKYPNSIYLGGYSLINDTNVKSVTWDDEKNEIFYYKSGILGASVVLDPNTEYFSDLYFDADYRMHNNAYKVDSIYIRGNYKRPFNTYTTPNGDVAIVDTLIIELVYGDTSQNNSFAPLFTINSPVKYYAAPKWLKDNDAVNGMGKLYGDGYKVIKIPLTEADVTLDENNIYSPYLLKYYGIKTDFNVPSQKYVGLVYTFKSGIPKDYLPADPIYTSSVNAETKGGIYQNMNSFMAALLYHKDDENIFYDPTSLSMNYALLKEHIGQTWSGGSSIFNSVLWNTDNIGWDVWFNLSLILSAGDDQTICEGTSATLTATGADTYSWSTGAKTASITVSPTVKTSYRVTGTTGGITDVDTVVVSIASINAGGDKTIIKGQQISLTATGDVSSYSWSTGAITKSIDVAPIVNTTYYVTGFYKKCVATDIVRVTVKDVLWYEDFTNTTNNFSLYNGLTRSMGNIYTCATTNYVAYTSGTKAYAMTKEFAVPQGKSIKLSLSSRRKNTTAGEIKIYYNIGGECSFNTMNTYNNGWVEWGNIIPNTSTATAGGCTNQNLTLTNEICGGQIVSVCFYFPNASASNWITVDDIEIIEANTMLAVPNISGSITYTENFTQQYWYAPVTQTYPNASTTGIKMPYHSLKTSSDAYVYLWSGGAGNTLDHTGSGLDYKVGLATGNEYCGNTGGTQIITKELNTSNCTQATATLRFDFQTKYPNTGNYGYISNEDYSLFTPKVWYSIGKPEGYLGNHSINWIEAPINYYFPIGKWMRATCQLPKAANIKVKISRGSAYIEYIDNIKVLCQDCSISNKTGANPIGETSPELNTNYIYTVGTTTGATYYRWVVRRKELGGTNPEATLYWDAPAGGNPGIVSGQGTTSAVINFGDVAGSYRVMCIPYSYNPGTFATPSDACYAKLGYIDATITTSSYCTAPALTAKANNTTTSLTICSGNTIALTANPSGGENCSGTWQYLWSNGANTQNVYNLTPTANTTYSVTVRCSADTTCYNTSQVAVNVNINPIADFTFDTVCSGFATQFTNTSIISEGDSLIFIEWDFAGIGSSNQLNPTFTFHGGGYYDVKVRVINNKGCIDSTIKNVAVYGSPVAQFIVDTVCLGTATSIKENSTKAVKPPSYGIVKWLWNFGDGSTFTFTGNFTHTYTSAGNYTVSLYVEDSIGCIGVSNKLAIVRELPTANAGVDKTICQGDFVRLTAGNNGYKYSWSPDSTLSSQNDSAPYAFPKVTTTYCVTVEDINGCTASDCVTVTVITTTVNAGADKTICQGENTTLTATEADTYLWSTGATTATINVNPTITTIYRVTGTKDGLTASDEVVVTVNPNPIIDIGFNKTICYGTSTILSVGSNLIGTSYVWSTGQNETTIIVSPLDTTIYTVTGTLNGCSGVDTVIVNVKPFPIANAGLDTVICFGATATLRVEDVGAYNYVWSTGSTGLTTNASPTITTTYTVTADINSCTTSDDVVVIVNPLPTANAGADKTINAGDTTIIIATGGITYAWNEGSAISTIHVGPIKTTTLCVTVTDINGCTASDCVTVTVITTTVNAGADKTICQGENTTLTATGADTYSWSIGATTATINVNPTITTTYRVTGTKDGFTASDEVVVVVNPLPTISAGVDRSICSGIYTILTATGGSIYTWDVGASTAAINVNPTGTTTYIVTATDAKGCANTSSVTVTVHSLPIANAGANKTIYKGQNATLIATGGNSYIWSTGANTESISVSPTITTTYRVTVTDTNGCTESRNVTVFVQTLTINAGVDKTICAGNTTTITATGANTYLWSNGDNTATINVNPMITTTYTVTGTKDGCTASDAVVVTVNPLPMANAGKDTIIEEGKTIILNASGGVIYAWSNGEATASIIVAPSITTAYSVSVTDINGCTASTSVIVSVIKKGLKIERIFAYQASCYEGNDGRAIVKVSGGKPPYSYTWSNGMTDDTINYLKRGVYTITVYDSEGDYAIGTTNIISPNYLEMPTIYASGITNSKATLNWNNIEGANTYMVRYREKNNGGWRYVNVSASQISIEISYLKENTEYEWQIRALKDNSTYSCFTDLNIFKTASANTCDIATNLKVEDITAGTAKIKWDFDNKTSRYLLRYKVKGADHNSYKYYYIDGAESSFVLNNLSLNTTYEYQIRKFCNDNFYSDFTDLKEFKTKSSCPVPENLNIRDLTATSVVLQWEASSDALVLMIRLREVGTDTWKYYTRGNASINKNALQVGCLICENIHKLKPNTDYKWQIRAFCNPSRSIYSDFTALHTFTTLPIDLNLGNDRTICKGQTIGIRTNVKADSYIWNTGDTTNYISVSPNINTTYTLSATVLGVVNTQSIVVYVKDAPEVSAGNDRTICSGEEVVLTGTGADNYKWNTGSLNKEVIFTPLVTTTYTVTGILDVCTASASVVVYVNLTPFGNAGPDIHLCKGETGTLNATGGAIYSWSTSETSEIISVSPTTTTSYFVTISNGDCSVTDIAVAVVTSIEASAGNDKTICKGQNIQLSATGGVRYEWNNGQNLPSINVSPIIDTEYIVTVFSANGCSATANVNIFVSNDLNVELTNDTNICNGERIVLTANLIDAISYRWNIGSIKSSINVKPIQTTTYTVTVSNGSCSGTKSVVVNVLNCKNEINNEEKFSNEVRRMAILNSQFSINIYPNPSYNGKLNIEVRGLEADTKLTLMSYTGAVLLERTVNSGDSKQKLDISNFADGIMFVRIGTETFKVVKN